METKKKAVKAKKAVEPVIEKEPIVEKTIVQEPVKKDNSWVIKDRVYALKEGLAPLSYTIKSSNIYYFDEEKGYERELKYTNNQKTPFVDEFVGDAKLEHITFEDGTLEVPKSKQTLQKLLSLYHPQRNKLFFEFDPEANAEDELDMMELEVEALNAAMSMEIDQVEAIVRTEVGNKASKMSSKELKRDLINIAKKSPKLFLELANDENINIRNMGIRAVEAGIIKLSPDQRTFTWGSTNRQLATVPYEENPYSALTAFFKTDEGIEVYKAIEKRLK
tara:strand:+ start:1080 stop:1910 length:831 start_codon:yes stop_codon:yes gene_type:complete